MIRILAAAIALLLLGACASTPPVPPAARADLTPTGKLRAGINFQNTLLTGRDPSTGAPRGVAVDLAHELARRLGVGIEIIPFKSAGQMADSVKIRAWDVAFLGNEPQRAKEIAFSTPYAEIEATYLVLAGSPVRSLADADQPGRRIVIPEKSAYDLALSRIVKHAQLVRVAGTANAYQHFAREKLDALAGLRPALLEFSDTLPGSRVLDGNFSVVQQSIGTPRGHGEAGAKYLAEFVEHAKATGFVARSIEKNGVRGLTVSPPARP